MGKWPKFKILPSLAHRFSEYPYPIHDWRDVELYTKDRTTKEWAWEFFRRNLYYQYDQDRYANKGHFPEFEIEYSIENSLLKQKNTTKEAQGLERFIGSFFDEVSLLRSHINDHYNYRKVKRDNGITTPIKNAIWEKYGVLAQSNTLLHDPRLELPDHNFFCKESSGIIYVPYLDNSSQEEQPSLQPFKPENIIFRLSADVSIKRQLAYVERELKKRRVELGIPSPKESPRKVDDSKYIKYIRLLDAFADYGLHKNSIVEKEKAIDIVSTIEPNKNLKKASYNSTLGDWKRPAFSLTQNGYLDLLEKV